MTIFLESAICRAWNDKEGFPFYRGLAYAFLEMGLIRDAEDMHMLMDVYLTIRKTEREAA